MKVLCTTLDHLVDINEMIEDAVTAIFTGIFGFFDDRQNLPYPIASDNFRALYVGILAVFRHSLMSTFFCGTLSGNIKRAELPRAMTSTTLLNPFELVFEPKNLHKIVKGTSGCL